MKKSALIIGILIISWQAFPQETSMFKDERDGKIYKTVKIGTQWIMAENLAFKPNNGNYWAFNNDTNFVPKYGYLYDWETALNVIPEGWHIPTIIELKEIMKIVSIDSFILMGAMYNVSLDFIDSETGFNPIIGSGMRKANGKFKNTNHYAYFWALKSSNISEPNPFTYSDSVTYNYHTISYNNSNASNISKYGLSVRLWLDNEKDLYEHIVKNENINSFFLLYFYYPTSNYSLLALKKLNSLLVTYEKNLEKLANELDSLAKFDNENEETSKYVRIAQLYELSGDIRKQNNDNFITPYKMAGYFYKKAAFLHTSIGINNYLSALSAEIEKNGIQMGRDYAKEFFDQKSNDLKLLMYQKSLATFRKAGLNKQEDWMEESNELEKLANELDSLAKFDNENQKALKYARIAQLYELSGDIKKQNNDNFITPYKMAGYFYNKAAFLHASIGINNYLSALSAETKKNGVQLGRDYAKEFFDKKNNDLKLLMYQKSVATFRKAGLDKHADWMEDSKEMKRVNYNEIIE